MPDIAEKERREGGSSAPTSRDGKREAGRKQSDDLRGQMQTQHTPVFKEHFEDDVEDARKDSALRAEGLANSEFVKRNSFWP